LNWANAGFDVELDADGHPKPVKIKPVIEETEEKPKKKRPGGKTPQKDKVSEATDREILGTTTEREPHGPRSD
jgi:hypothetical protein